MDECCTTCPMCGDIYVLELGKHECPKLRKFKLLA